MTDLILEYGINSFLAPIALKTPEEVNLFSLASKSLYFDRLPKPSSDPTDNSEFLIIKSAFFDESKKVPDVYRYDLIFTDKWTLVHPETRTSAYCCDCSDCRKKYPDKNNILVILESPHKNEYCKEFFKPLVPANGATGTDFCEYFTHYVLKHSLGKAKRQGFSLESILNTKKIYSICFVNPVPFQTSLYFIRLQTSLYFIRRGGLSSYREKKLRNYVWEKLFSLFKDKFIDRMKFYSSIQPVIILNTCTSFKPSKKGITLQQMVKEEIDPAIKYRRIKCTNKFNTHHPCSWNL